MNFGVRIDEVRKETAQNLFWVGLDFVFQDFYLYSISLRSILIGFSEPFL